MLPAPKNGKHREALRQQFIRPSRSGKFRFYAPMCLDYEQGGVPNFGFVHGEKFTMGQAIPKPPARRLRQLPSPPVHPVAATVGIGSKLEPIIVGGVIRVCHLGDTMQSRARRSRRRGVRNLHSKACTPSGAPRRAPTEDQRRWDRSTAPQYRGQQGDQPMAL